MSCSVSALFLNKSADSFLTIVMQYLLTVSKLDQQSPQYFPPAHLISLQGTGSRDQISLNKLYPAGGYAEVPGNQPYIRKHIHGLAGCCGYLWPAGDLKAQH